MNNLKNIPKQPARSLPKHWQLKKLGEICTYSKGKKPAILKEVKTNECSIPYINIKAFEKGIISEYTNGEKCNICEDGDLLMVWDGARCGLIGKAKKGAVGSTLMKILPKENILKEYLYHFISSKFWTLNTKPKGVGIPHIEPSLLWNFELVIPPLPEQQAIVAKIEELLSELENGKQQLLTAQQQLKVYRQSLLKWAFEGKLTNKNVKEGELPKGWKTKKLKEITTVLGDGLHGTPKYSETGEYYFINGNNLNDGKIEIKRITKRVSFEEYNKYKKPLSENSVLVSINGSLGYTAFYNNEKVVLGKSACYFNVIDSVSKHYVRYFLTTSFFQSYAIKNATGSTIKNVGLKAMRELPIPIPETLEEQQLIVSELESKLTVCDKIEETINQSLQQAETLKQSILKKAFEGKLVVSKEPEISL
jgi:type I restriction enzyme S subunit